MAKDIFRGNDPQLGQKVKIDGDTSAYIASVMLVDVDGNPTSGGGGGTGGGGGPVTVSDGANIAQGARADAAYTGTGSATIVSILKGIFARLVTNGGLSSGVDRSGTITAANTGQQVAPANPNRRAMAIQNTSSNDLFINEVGNPAGAAGTAGTYTLPAGGTFTVKTTNAISIRGATVGQSYTSTESS